MQGTHTRKPLLQRQMKNLAKSRMPPQAKARNAKAKNLQHTSGHAGQLGSTVYQSTLPQKSL